MFYISIGITIVYSCRLLLLILGFTSSGPVLTASSPSSLLLTAPMLVLLLFGALEGYLLASNAIGHLSSLNYYEKLLVYLLFLASPCLAVFLNYCRLPSISRVTTYTVFGRVVSSSLIDFNSLVSLERSSFQRFGITQTSRLLGQTRLLGALTSKVFVFLACILVLV